MSISYKMIEFSKRGSWIRKMFEQGAKLKAQYGAENIFDFSLGNPDLEPPAQFDEVLRQRVSCSSQGQHGYMPNSGYQHVREAVAKQISIEQGEPLTFNDVLMTCGAAGGLNVVMKSILNPGDEVILLAPFFVEYNFYVDNHGGGSKVVNTSKDFSLDLQAIEKAIGKKTKAIIINSPNNPTGQIYSSESIERLGKLLESCRQKYGSPIFLVADEPYRKIVYDNLSVPAVLEKYSNSIVVSSYSKDLSLPGERIGYIAIHPNIEEKEPLLESLSLANRILGFVNAPALMQHVVGELQGITVDCSIYKRRRDTFCNILADCGYDFELPKGAFYIFPKSPIDDVEFVAMLQKHKILAVPGKGFGAPGYFRLAYCVEDKVIENSAAAFCKAMQEAKDG